MRTRRNNKRTKETESRSDGFRTHEDNWKGQRGTEKEKTESQRVRDKIRFYRSQAAECEFEISQRNI